MNPRSHDHLLYAHCKKCLAEVPPRVSMKEWARLEVAIDTDRTIYITCTRHDLGVLKTRPGAFPGARNLSCSECEEES